MKILDDLETNLIANVIGKTNEDRKQDLGNELITVAAHDKAIINELKIENLFEHDKFQNYL